MATSKSTTKTERERNLEIAYASREKNTQTRQEQANKNKFWQLLALPAYTIVESIRGIGQSNQGLAGLGYLVLWTRIIATSIVTFGLIHFLDKKGILAKRIGWQIVGGALAISFVGYFILQGKEVEKSNLPKQIVR